MKKLLLICFIVMSTPVLALCSIADGESVCSIQNNSSAVMPLFQNNTDTKNNNQNQPKNNVNSFGQTRNREGIQMQGSLSCQFGNCKKESNNDFLPNQ